MRRALRVDVDGPVQHLTMCRAADYNTITPQLRDELAEALDSAEGDPEIRAVLLDAEGPSSCAGYDLDWSTVAHRAEETDVGRADGSIWDSMADLAMIGRRSATTASGLRDPA